MERTTLNIEGIGKKNELFLPFKENPNYLVGNKGSIYSLSRGRLIGTINDYGYYHCWINDRWIKTHQMVWTTWVGEIPEGMEINHKNLKRHCNRINNLELVTRLQNSQHRIAFRKERRGEIGDIDAVVKCCKYERAKHINKDLPRGEYHHKFTGYYNVNGIEFPTAKQAASLLGISAYKLRQLCNKDLEGYGFQPADRKNRSRKNQHNKKLTNNNL